MFNMYKVPYILIVVIIVVILLTNFMLVPAKAQSTNNSTDNITDTNNTTNTINKSNFTGFQDPDHNFQFSPVETKVVEKSGSQFIVQIYNYGNESVTLSVEGLNGPKSKNSVVFNPEELRTLNLTPFNPFGLYATITISEYAPRSAVVGQNMSLNNTFHLIEYYLIQPKTEPDVPHKSFIVFLGGLSVILMLLSGYLFNSRPTRMAKPINRSDVSISEYVDSPNYSFKEDDPPVLKLVKFTINWIKSWGLIIVNILIIIWGSYRFLGFSVAGSYTLDFYFFMFDIVIPQLMEDSMVYMMYGNMLFWIVFFVGMYIAKQTFVELSDVKPKTGDNYLYRLTKPRFRDLTVLTDVKKPLPNSKTRDKEITYEVPHDWIFEINKETKRDAYEVYDFDIHNNVCKVSWSGELKKLNPSQLRQSKNTIDYVRETSMWAIDRYYKFLDFYAYDVLQEARYIMARRTAIIEDAELEGLGDTKDRVVRRMEKRGEADAIQGDELSVANEVNEDANFDLVENKQQDRSEAEIVDVDDIEDKD